MKNVNLLLIFCIIFLISFPTTYAQKIEIPIQWKTGDTWTYDLKQRNLGGITGQDRIGRMNFQIKVSAKESDGYEVEWRYLFYSTFEADTLEDEYSYAFQQFLLKTPILLKLNQKGEFAGWIDRAALQKKFQSFYISQSNKPHSTLCLETLQSFMTLAEGNIDFLDASMPEIRNFFLSFSLLPAKTNFKQDTIDVFKDYILDFNRTITLPRTISVKASDTFSNTVEINYINQLSEPDYKKYFDESTRASWDKLGLEKGDEMRKDLEAQLEVFQPKKSTSMNAVFDRSNGSIIQFEYSKEDWDKLKGGENLYYYFTKR